VDFTYDDEQLALRDAVRGLLGKAYGDFERRRAVTASEPGFDEELWGRLAELGALALPFAEEDGGMGAGPVEVGIVLRELGRVLAPEPYLVSVVLAGGLVAAAGTPEQRADLLGRLSSGDLVLTAALSSGVRAVEAGDAWTLSGVQEPVPHGGRADVVVAAASLPGGGTGLFVVDGASCDRAGYASYDGGRSARVRYDATPATPLGSPGAAVRATIAAVRDAAVILGANEALGVMQAQVQATRDYLTSRKQFGVTLNTFQALTFRAADMYVSLELTHSMVDWATMVLASGSGVADAADRVGLQVSRAGRHVGQEAIQLHGGIAMTAEYSVGVATAHLTALEQLLGSGGHHLGRLSSRLEDHEDVDPLR
jgi:alkylation response protein AidB-like acyl-CoA dehydrogenase